MIMRYQTVLVRFVVVIFLAISVLQLPAQQVLYQQTSEVNNLMVQYNADRSSLNRFYFVDNSPERRDRFATLNNDYLKQLQQLKFESMPVGSRVDYLLFKRDLEENLRLLDIEQKEVAQLSGWFPFASGIYAIEK